MRTVVCLPSPAQIRQDYVFLFTASMFNRGILSVTSAALPLFSAMMYIINLFPIVWVSSMKQSAQKETIFHYNSQYLNSF